MIMHRLIIFGLIVLTMYLCYELDKVKTREQGLWMQVIALNNSKYVNDHNKLIQLESNKKYKPYLDALIPYNKETPYTLVNDFYGEVAKLIP